MLTLSAILTQAVLRTEIEDMLKLNSLQKMGIYINILKFTQSLVEKIPS